MIIAKIALESLKGNPSLLEKIDNILSPLSQYFKESGELLVESSIGPDSIMAQYSQLWMFFHYKDLPIAYHNDYYWQVVLKDPDSQNASHTLLLASLILKDSQSRKHSKSKALVDSLMLRYLIHVTGDVHQPLHCSSLFSTYKYEGKLKDGDEGGNYIPVHDLM